MNDWARNFPPPLELTIYSDAGLSARREIVANICEKINELSEFAVGLEHTPIPVPSQAAGSDERMPLIFLRPCIDRLNNIMAIRELSIREMSQLGSNMDYHAFMPTCKAIVEVLNTIIEELR